MRAWRRKSTSFFWMYSSSCALTAVVGAKGLSQIQQRTSRLMWRGICSFPDSNSEPVGDRAVNMSPLLSWDKTLRAPHGTANKQRKERGKKRDRIEFWNPLCFRDLKSILWMSHHITWTHGTSSDWLVRGSPSVTQNTSGYGPTLRGHQTAQFSFKDGLSMPRYLQPRRPHLSRQLWALSDSDYLS